MENQRGKLRRDGVIRELRRQAGYKTKDFPSEYIPTIFPSYSANVVVEDQCINLRLWDTSGSEDLKNARILPYFQTDVFVSVFSLVCPTSPNNIRIMLVLEIREHCPNHSGWDGVQCLRLICPTCR
jgi:GTPase SAR1 family protein